MKNIIIGFLNFIIDIANKIVKRLTKEVVTNKITMDKIQYHNKGRYLIYYFNNTDLESSSEQVLKYIFTLLMSDDRFKNFGENKTIITTAYIDGDDFAYHPNVLITNKTTFEEYYNYVERFITENYEDGYPCNVIPRFRVRVWNMDHLANKTIKINATPITKNRRGNFISRGFHSCGFQTVTMSSTSLLKSGFHNSSIGLSQYNDLIGPLKPNFSDEVNKLATMDIETMSLPNFPFQVPVAITTAYQGGSKIFLIDNTTLHSDNIATINKSINDMWTEYVNFMLTKPGLFEYIFVHNLGSFDGLFLYKGLLNCLDPSMISCIIDDHNKFITITYTNGDVKLVWKDSYRIFPVSLDNLCKVFNVSGKISEYNPEFNQLSLFDNQDLFNQFKDYSLQDSLSLYSALVEAQNLYMKEYQIDITTIFSTSTLSLKIFRSSFLKVNIPILKGMEDSFIRKGYYGGATDYYKAKVTKAKYIDVNSLYPFAMCKPMPLDIKQFHHDLSNVKLDDFFGFALVEIDCPKDIRPVLPYRVNGKTIFPTGRWISTYYSEELKAVQELGYKITLIKGYEYTKTYLFNEYVDHFYDIKKNSTGSQRFIAKMQLNQLYGYFGRKQELLRTVNVKTSDISKYLASQLIKTIIDINDEYSTLLIHVNVETNTLFRLNSLLETNINCFETPVKSNVAIAAAVTAYARIHMIPYKLDPGCVYTDTDSTFTTSDISQFDIGNELVP